MWHELTELFFIILPSFLCGMMTTALICRLRKVIAFALPENAAAYKENIGKRLRTRRLFSHEVTEIWSAFRDFNVLLLRLLLLSVFYRKLRSYIKSAKKSIDLRVSCISCDDLVHEVKKIQRHREEVRVRIIIADLKMEMKGKN